MWRETGTKEKKERVLHKEEKNAHLNTGSLGGESEDQFPRPSIDSSLATVDLRVYKDFFFCGNIRILSERGRTGEIKESRPVARMPA